MAYRDRKSSVGRRAAQLGVPLALALLLAGCGGEDPTVRKATTVLGELAVKNDDHAGYAAGLVVAAPSPQGDALLLLLIVSEDNQIARAAVKAMVENPPESAREPLRRVFAERRGLLKLDAGIALARLGDQEAYAWVREEVLAGSGGSMTLEAFKLLASRPEEEAVLTDIAQSRMKNDEPSIRNEAYVFLAAARQAWSTRLLAGGLGNERGAEREQAIISLGTTGEPGAAPFVEKFLNTRGLVFASIEALGDLGNPDVIPALKPSLESDTALVRLYAGAAIWQLGDEETGAAVLEPMVDDESADLRNNLALQLRDVASPRARALLVRLATDEDAQVRLAAIRALSRAKDGAAREVFLTGLADKSYQVQTSALDALAIVGTAEDVVAIGPLLENRNPYVALSAASTVLGITARSPGAS